MCRRRFALCLQHHAPVPSNKRRRAVISISANRSLRSHLTISRNHAPIQSKTRGESNPPDGSLTAAFSPVWSGFAFAGGLWCSTVAFAMRSLVFLLAGLFASTAMIYGEFKTPENAPIEITSTGQTTYENGLATARDNVAIHIGNTDIYADYAQYNSSTHDVVLRGHVRIYREASLYIAESGVYNTETKKIRAQTARTESVPYFLKGGNVTSISDNGYLV